MTEAEQYAQDAWNAAQAGVAALHAQTKGNKMITDVNLRDETAGLEYSLQCDLEKGQLLGWTVTCINPLPLQMAFNTPFLNRPAGVQSPCAKAAEANQPTRVNKMRIGPNGEPVRG